MSTENTDPLSSSLYVRYLSSHRKLNPVHHKVESNVSQPVPHVREGSVVPAGHGELCLVFAVQVSMSPQPLAG